MLPQNFNATSDFIMPYDFKLKKKSFFISYMISTAHWNTLDTASNSISQKMWIRSFLFSMPQIKVVSEEEKN